MSQLRFTICAALCATLLLQSACAATMNAQYLQFESMSNNDCTGNTNAIYQMSQTGCTKKGSYWIRLGCSSDLTPGSNVVAVAAWTAAGCSGAPASVVTPASAGLSASGYAIGCNAAGFKTTCVDSLLVQTSADTAKTAQYFGNGCAAGGPSGFGFFRNGVTSACLGTSGERITCNATTNQATIQSYGGSLTCAGSAAVTNTSTCASDDNGVSFWNCEAVTAPPKAGSAFSVAASSSVQMVFAAMMAILAFAWM